MLLSGKGMGDFGLDSFLGLRRPGLRPGSA